MAKMLLFLVAAVLPAAVHAQLEALTAHVLPAGAAKSLGDSLKAAAPHARHIWRDTPAVNSDGTINAYIEISRGDRRKWEFDMAARTRRIDRMMPAEVGGYPINYGFVPQTISYDGDPFDVLVLGPPLTGGRIVRGVAVGLMLMEDEKGADSKVVISMLDAKGTPLHRLTPERQREVADYFARYKKHQPGAFSRVPGWASANDGLSMVRLTHQFFRQCRAAAGSSCAIDQTR